MKHYGDITKLHGGDLPFVDVIAGGSPCQDLSVAGKRAGMLNEANGDEETTRSGLFYDQIRINKEMREAYAKERARGSGELVRPVRYSIWENVPGAFSSNGGKDFQAVLTEFIRIVEPEAPDVPLPEKGKWPTAGCLYDEMGRWSLAWRLHDLQFWGCPQRRKRLCVLVDFDGPTAPWILFDPEFRGEAEDTPPVETESDTRTEPRSEVQPLGEGLCGYSEQSGAQGQGTAGAAESSTGVASTITATYGTKWNGNAGAYSGGNFVIEEPESYTLKIRGGIDVDSHGRKAGKGALIQTELSGTLGVSQDQTLIQPCLNSWDVQSKHVQPEDGVAEALYSGECRGGGGESYVFTQNQREEIRDLGDTAGSLAAENGSHQQTYVLPINTMVGTRDTPEMRTTFGIGDPDDPQFTLSAAHEHGVFVDVYNQSVDGEVAASLTAASGGTNTSGPKVMSAGFKPRQGAAARSLGYEEEMSPTVNTDENYGVLCLNDQGGGVMNITEDKTNALRAQMKHHEPIVYNGETVTCPTNKQLPHPGDPSHTLTADDRNYLVYENHSQDSRYKELGDVSETVSAKYGTGGNNQPLVLESNQNHATVTEDGVCNTLPAAMGMGGGYIPMVTYGIDQQGGKGGANYAEDVCPAVLSDSHGTPHAVAYGISSLDSNAMKSSNPHSGIYEADTSRTLDLNGGSPACNQGGVMILNPSDSQGNQVADDDGVYPTLRGCGGAGYQQGYCLDKNSEPIPLEGNGQRESHRGDGYGKPGDPSFTLNSTEHHGVAESYQDTTGALMASGYSKLGTQEAANDMYVVTPSNWDGSQVSPTLTSNNAGGNQRMPDKDNFNAVIQPPVECLQVGFYQATGDMAPSLLSRDYKDPPVVSKAVDVRNGCESEDTNGSLQSKASNNLNSNNVCRTGAVVRRLTPKECERLQGFPDDWTDLGEWTDSKGKTHKDADSPRYKALGNSIGLPFWQWLAESICAQYPEGTQVRLGSLFDGIGGFPLVFERNGGKAVWASEIEEFPIAVTKKHFPEED